MRSWSKLMGFETIRKPPGSRVSPDFASVSWPDRFLGATVCWARAMLPAIMAVAAIVSVASFPARESLALNQNGDKTLELWLGGDVSLGDGGRGQLQGISGIVQGSAGIVNLEGPVTERPGLKAGSLRLWNAPKALGEISALNVKVAGIANNHAGDAGAGGPQQSAARLLEGNFLPAGGPAGAAIFEVN